MSVRNTILPSITALAVACTAIVLAACGSSASKSADAVPATSAPAPIPAMVTTAAATGSFNSCSVVTRAEAASAIGQAVTPGVLGHATVEGGLACDVGGVRRDFRKWAVEERN